MLGFALYFLRAPLALVGYGAVLAAICGCLACRSCRGFKLRDMRLMKWLLRASGTDTYDEFELLVQVHEVSFVSQYKAKTSIRLMAGQQVVSTAKNKKGIFQEVLSIFVEQGTNYLIVDLLTENKMVLATLKLNIVKDIIEAPAMSSTTSKTFPMHQRERGVLNPTVTLTFYASPEVDAEQGLLAGEEDAETAFLMRKHLSMAQQEVMTTKASMANSNVSKMPSVMQCSAFSEVSQGDVEALDVLVQACAGPIELFSGLGNAHKRYLRVIGPPSSRRFVLGLYKDLSDIEAGRDAEKEVDVLKIQGVMADPGQHDVFLVGYYDKQLASKKLRCRILDRPTKVWVETLTLLITRVHNFHKTLRVARNDKKKAADLKSLRSRSLLR